VSLKPSSGYARYARAPIGKSISTYRKQAYFMGLALSRIWRIPRIRSELPRNAPTGGSYYMKRNVSGASVTRHPHGVRHGVRPRLSARFGKLRATTPYVVVGVWPWVPWAMGTRLAGACCHVDAHIRRRLFVPLMRAFARSVQWVCGSMAPWGTRLHGVRGSMGQSWRRRARQPSAPSRARPLASKRCAASSGRPGRRY